MGVTDRAAEAIGGPRGGTTWYDAGDSFTLQNHASVTATTTNNLLPMQTVTRPNTGIASFSTIIGYGDQLSTYDNIIQYLYGFQLTLAGAGLAAQTTLRLTMSVFGSIGSLAANLVAPSGVTSLTLGAGLTRSLPNGSVITLTATDGTLQNATLAAAAAVGQGAASSPLVISSLTSAKTFNAAVPISWQVGNNPCFGWPSTVDALGGSTGTPVFPANVGIVAPTVAANTSLLTAAGYPSALPVQPGDALMLNLKTDSGTVVLPVSNIQPLMV